MVLMQVGWSEDVQVLLVWCIFGDGLGDQPPALTQAYQIGAQEGLCANPSDGSWQGEWGIPCLTQTQSFS